jgi:hypothetical protein
MAKTRTRRNESLRLALLLLLLAISHAYAPPFLLGGLFGNQTPGGKHDDRIIQEAAKHGWPGLPHGRSGVKVHDKIGRRDCLQWRLDPNAHCLTAAGFLDSGGHGASDTDDGNSAGGTGGSFSDSGLGGLFLVASSGAGSHGGENSGGGTGGGGSKGGDGSHGGGNSGGGSQGGGASGGGDPPDGNNSGDGSHGGGDPACPAQAFCDPPAGDPAAPTSVPEPSTLWLMLAGIACLVAHRAQRQSGSVRNLFS